MAAASSTFFAPPSSSLDIMPPCRSVASARRLASNSTGSVTSVKTVVVANSATPRIASLPPSAVAVPPRNSAAMTYIAAAATSLMTLLYWASHLGLFGGRRD